MSPAPARVTVDLRRPLPFALLTLASFLVARWLGIGLHEVVGHGLFAVLAGGSFYGVYVSPVTGFALIHMSPDTNEGIRVLIVLAGILVEVVAGILILRLFPKLRTFVGRIFGLTLLEVLLVYSFAYLALGISPATGGDPGQVVAILGALHLGVAFLVVGMLWAIGVGYVISVEVLRLVAPEMTLRRRLAYIVLFWIVPLPVAAVPNAIATVFASASLVTLVLLLFAIGASLVVAGSWLSKDASELPPLGRPPGRVIPIAIAALVVLPAWLAFGLTPEFAEQLLLSEPPLAAERDLANPLAVNARVTLTPSEDVLLEFWMKGVPSPRSPLERRAFATFEDRADFTFWAPAAGLLANVMMNATSWNVSGTRIDTATTLWFDGMERSNPRLVTLELAKAEDKPFFLRTTQNGSRTFLTLTVLDPFRHLPVECPGCFIDELNLTWPAAGGAYVLVDVTALGGTPEEIRGTDFARFRASTFPDSPELWRLVLERI